MLTAIGLALWLIWVLPGLLSFVAGPTTTRAVHAGLALTWYDAAAGIVRSSGVTLLFLPTIVVFAVAFAAAILAYVRRPGERAVFATALLAPALSGPTTFAFFWRNVAGQSGEHVSGLLSILFALAPWVLMQAVPLLVGFLVISVSAKMEQEQRYADAVGITPFRCAVLSLLGNQKWFIVCFAFVLGTLLFNDRIVTELALRPSAGGGNELASHALERIYHLIAFSLSPLAAAQVVFIYALAAALAALLVTVAATAIALPLARFVGTSAARDAAGSAVHCRYCRMVALAVLIAVVIGLWAVPLHAIALISNLRLAALGLSGQLVGAGTGAALLLVAGSVAAAAAYRRWALGAHLSTGEVLIVLFLLIPPAAIGLSWMYSAGRFSAIIPHAFGIGWLIATSLSYFPLGFLIAALIHRYIDPRTLRYSRRVGLSDARFELIAFVRRFPGAIVALFTILALSIWGDWGASAAFAGAVNVFAELLITAISGRAENLGSAATLSWLSLLLASGAAGLIALSFLKRTD